MAYWALHIVNQKLFFMNKHVISIIMQLFHSKFFLYVILFCGKNLVKILWLFVPRTFFSDQESDSISVVVLTLGLGLCCSPLKEMRFQQPTTSPDYHKLSPLSCEPFVVLMVRRLISLGGCFSPPPTPPTFLIMIRM